MSLYSFRLSSEQHENKDEYKFIIRIKRYTEKTTQEAGSNVYDYPVHFVNNIQTNLHLNIPR